MITYTQFGGKNEVDTPRSKRSSVSCRRSTDTMDLSIGVTKRACSVLLGIRLRRYSNITSSMVM